MGFTKFACSLVLPSLFPLVFSKKALLIVDVQDCFLDQNTTSGSPGSLSVTNSHTIIPVINRIRNQKDCLFDIVVRSQDFHPNNHISFASTNKVSQLTAGTEVPMRCTRPTDGSMSNAACCPDPTRAISSIVANLSQAKSSMSANPACSSCFTSNHNCFNMNQAMWPDHCLQTGDSKFPPTLVTKTTDTVVQKGNYAYVDAYSAFMDNTRTLRTSLNQVLSTAGVTEVYLAGIATDFCVYWSARDAIYLNYTTFLIEDASAGIGISLSGSATTITQARADMVAKGVVMTNSTAVLSQTCKTFAAGYARAQTFPFQSWMMAVFTTVLMLMASASSDP